jgi:hypothetical protein
MAGAVKRGEVALGGVADHHHVSPPSSIPPVGTAPGHVRLAAKADAAVAASPPFDVDLGAVVEHDVEGNPDRARDDVAVAGCGPAGSGRRPNPPKT